MRLGDSPPAVLASGAGLDHSDQRVLPRWGRTTTACSNAVRFGGISPICVSEGGLEPRNAGNFPSLGKFPWFEDNGRCPQAPGISRYVPLPGSAGGRMFGGRPLGGARTQPGGNALCCPQSPGKRNIRRSVLMQTLCRSLSKRRRMNNLCGAAQRDPARSSGMLRRPCNRTAGSAAPSVWSRGNESADVYRAVHVRGSLIWCIPCGALV
jgi:hypothetical protein